MVIDPELLPFARGRVEEIIARARIAPASRRPVFLHHAAALHEHDAVGPRHLALRVGHLPRSHPEVKLLRLLVAAGAGRCAL